MCMYSSAAQSFSSNLWPPTFAFAMIAAMFDTSMAKKTVPT